ncbi:MAG: hypothetical protein ACTSU5_18010 [Promethearchaeota archaeon]
MIEIISKWPREIQDLVKQYNRGVEKNDREAVEKVLKTIFETVGKMRNPDLKRNLLWAVSLIPEKNPEVCAEYIPQVSGIVKDDAEDSFTRIHGLDFLRQVGKSFPEKLEVALESVVKNLDDDFDLVRFSAAQALQDILNKDISMINKPHLVRELKFAGSDPDNRVRNIIRGILSRLVTIREESEG